MQHWCIYCKLSTSTSFRRYPSTVVFISKWKLHVLVSWGERNLSSNWIKEKSIIGSPKHFCIVGMDAQWCIMVCPCLCKIKWMCTNTSNQSGWSWDWKLSVLKMKSANIGIDVIRAVAILESKLDVGGMVLKLYANACFEFYTSEQCKPPLHTVTQTSLWF